MFHLGFMQVVLPTADYEIFVQLGKVLITNSHEDETMVQKHEEV
jgi:hypothetical protein